MGIRTTGLAVAVLLAISGPGAAAAACGKTAPQLVRLKIFSPLIMLEHGASTDVSIDEAGCVTSRFPVTDKRHGVHSYQLTAAELAAFKRDIRSAGLDRVEESDLREPAAKSADQVHYYTSDPDIIELSLAAGMAAEKSDAPKFVRMQGLDAELKNRPQVSWLHSLAAVKTRVIEVGTDARLEKRTPR